MRLATMCASRMTRSRSGERKHYPRKPLLTRYTGNGKYSSSYRLLSLCPVVWSDLMQPDQPGDASLAAAQTQTERSPRARVGTGARGSMRVTNRYTMPPLTPRTRQQRSTNLWDAQGSVPFDEDAWLNDALPTAPARIESRESALPAGD